MYCCMLQDGQTALHVSSRLDDDDTVQLLLQHNADIDALMRDHYTPLHIAVKHQHSNIINILLSHGAKLDIKSKVYQRSHKMTISSRDKVMFTVYSLRLDCHYNIIIIASVVCIPHQILPPPVLLFSDYLASVAVISPINNTLFLISLQVKLCILDSFFHLLGQSFRQLRCI